MYGGIVFLLLSFVGVAKALTEQKTIKVSTTENDVYLDMNANCNDCWTSSIDISQCPEDEFKTIDEGSISVDLYPYGPDGPGAPVDPRSYSCLPK